MRGRGACVAGGHVCGGRGMHGRGHAWYAYSPPPPDTTRYGDMVNKWAVHILLECICVNIIITARNEVVAKVIFLYLFVILFTRGCLPQCMLGCHTPLRADTPKSRHPWEQTPPRADTPQDQTPRKTRHPPPGKQTPA